MLRHVRSTAGARWGGSDDIQEAFLNEIFLQLVYKTYTPGEVLINFSDPPDEMLIIVDGKVSVEFDHPTVQRPGLVLNQGSVAAPASDIFLIASPLLPSAPCACRAPLIAAPLLDSMRALVWGARLFERDSDDFALDSHDSDDSD